MRKSSRLSSKFLVVFFALKGLHRLAQGNHPGQEGHRLLLPPAARGGKCRDSHIPRVITLG